MRGCLSLPFRLLSLGIMLALGYFGWVHRDDLRRWIHRATAEPAPAPAAPAVDDAELARRARARIDSVRVGRADSVMVPSEEAAALLAGGVERRTGGAVDGVSVTFGDGDATVRAMLDAARLPMDGLGPLKAWVGGRQPLEAAGELGLRRVGLGEWRVESVRVRGVPLPKALASRLVGLLVPGEGSSVTFALPDWVTGLRVTPSGAILYGRRAGR